jgi:competence protein ComEA
MKKFAALLVGLLLAAFNVLAAVNVNTATQDQLQTLNGIGPVKAKAIIDYRNKNGAFKSVDDLDKVPGIGPSVLGKIKADVTVSGSTTVKPEAKPEARVDAKKSAPTKTAEPGAPVSPPAPVVKTESAKAAKVDPAKPVAASAPEAAKADKKAEKDAKKAEKAGKTDDKK